MELGGEDSVQADRLASWRGVCPGNAESAGKRPQRRNLSERANATVRTKGGQHIEACPSVEQAWAKTLARALEC